MQDGNGETWGLGKDTWVQAMNFKEDSSLRLNTHLKIFTWMKAELTEDKNCLF